MEWEKIIFRSTSCITHVMHHVTVMFLHVTVMFLRIQAIPSYIDGIYIFECGGCLTPREAYFVRMCWAVLEDSSQ